MATDGASQVRSLTVGMRRLLTVAAGLVGLAAFQLFVLTDHTDAYFSWTILPGMTAAFLGAGYAASFFLEFLASRRAVWVDARHTVPPVLSFTILTETATLLHLGKFQFGEQLVWAGAAAWVWISIYTVVPIAMIALLPGQLRVSGTDPLRRAALPTPAAAVLAVQGAILLPVGALLFASPVRWASIWPWELTPLTGRAVGAWLLGIGIGEISVIAERDLLRTRPALVSYTVLGALQFVALARYSGDVDWSQPQAWIYLTVVASILAMGVFGVVAGSRVGTRVSEAPPA